MLGEDLAETDKALLRKINLRVANADTMYEPGGGAKAYLTAGLSASRCLQAVVDKWFCGNLPHSTLDLPSGFGRVLRFLKVLFPDSEITAGEIQSDALAFCQSAFGVRTFQSSADVKSLSLPRKFDLIWSGSLITHLDETATSRLLSFFHRHLAEGGACVFTAHGVTPAERIKTSPNAFHLTDEAREKVLRGYQTTGYGYADYSSNAGYGISVTSHARIMDLARAAGSWEPILNIQDGWHDIQDVYAFGKPGGPRGLAVTGGDLGAAARNAHHNDDV